MNEKLVVLSFADGETGVTLGDAYRAIKVPFDLTIVYVSASPNVDDAGLTIDVNDDGVAAVAATPAATLATPGTWRSTHVGGTNAPVQVAAGSILTLDANAAAANTAVLVQIWALTGEVSG